MLGHMIGQIKPKTAATSNEVAQQSTRPEQCQEQITGTINRLHALSRRGLWGILLFATLSAVTLYCHQAGLFALLPIDGKALFGDLPPSNLLHVVLAVSWLSAFVLILGRVSGDGEPTYNWCNIGLPTVFYPLYIFSDAGASNFPAVFAAGLVLLLIEHASVMLYVSKALREEKERLTHLQLH
jgi:hypothetical protein